jgi:LacI family transcriptional regulator
MNITIDYIAKVANVSKATVSRVINNKAEGVGKETRARVQAVIRQYGYSPNLLARSVATSHTKTIGLVIPDITNPFFSAIVKAIEEYAAVHGYSVILCDTNSSAEKEKKSAFTLIASRVDGVILATELDDKSDWKWEFSKFNIPCVLIDRRLNNQDFDASVFVDNEYAVYIVTEMMIRHGNRKIAFLKGADHISTTNERLQGYKSALKQYRMPMEERLISSGEYSFDGGYAAMKRLLDVGVPFSAVVASSDIMAIGALRALRDAGLRVPEDIEIAGFDNIAFSAMVDPPLTTMEQPVYALGQKAAEVLIHLMGGYPLTERNIRLEARLVLRKSTKNIDIGYDGITEYALHDSGAAAQTTA